MRLVAFVAVWVCVLALALSGQNARAADQPDDSDRRINDCGVNCLYVLLRLNGREVDLGRLRAAVPPPGELGLSMEDLRMAGNRQGLSLVGVKLGPRDFPLDRPAIVLLKSGDRGHYVVIEPAGTTGTMAMQLDFPRPARLVDYDKLTSRPDWTGLALIPERPNWVVRIAGGAAIASGVGLVVIYLVPRWRGRARRISPPAVTAAGGRDKSSCHGILCSYRAACAQRRHEATPRIDLDRQGESAGVGAADSVEESVEE